MKCGEIISILQQLAPESMAMDWDNPGLLAGRRDKEVETIYLALDATDQVVEDAVWNGTDLLLTHHPLIFKPLKQINDESFIGRRLLSLIENGISYYAMHTNFDSAPGCMADLAADRLGLEKQKVLEVTGEKEGIPFGIGKTGELPEEMTVRQLAGKVKEAFGLPFVTVYGDLEKRVKACGISPGSGGSMIAPAVKQGMEVLVTGDIGHHDGIDSVANHMAVIDAGHYGLEHIYMDFMEEYLKKCLKDPVKIVRAPLAFPAAVI